MGWLLVEYAWSHPVMLLPALLIGSPLVAAVILWRIGDV